MDVFWAKGYEAASLTELMVAMGLNPPSFYAAFGSKDALYRESVDLYLATVGGGSMKVLAETPGVREAIERMLLASLEVALASPSSGGCMVSLGLFNCQAQNAPLREHMCELRRSTTRLIRQRLERGVGDGELAAGTDTERLATYFATIIQGISFQAQDGAGRQALLGIVETAMAAFEATSNPV
ncbi:Regulatory protein, TetR-family [Azotobacter vinelandii CA]|uniref:Regulatory protein, TetR-family n=3 Tax=Azotobacter group TaxID=351 RepID=C1DR70_AZOVD|nr:Regulatory protein, TetR-family [Azotobacter vinelandii DJ]AGK14590.1 Regulatory protein, TetR-family [Azotobacter vinelandii CA]AGK21447.1 Regulatory protein, TetR-family [Azotobacter vinelandii CA6]